MERKLESDSYFPVPSEVIQQISRLGSEIREIQAQMNSATADVRVKLERLKRERSELVRLVQEKYRRWHEVEVKGGPK